ncbi:hypothetical protein [Amycolatopsis anabasis]|uniref:hypothetical protein n=1 Tax=Amycolatopsis anabasis TaxID=1840409 RepID=UPI001FE94D09|nr:hypothetical protein [Amycolatopsis anabasis]
MTHLFRRWRRPTVKAGGTLRTAIGALRIDAVDRVDEAAISDDEARRAGHASADALRRELARRDAGAVYRIEVSLAGPDPRIALRERVAEGADLAELRAALARLDRASGRGPWTGAVLRALADRPGVRAADLAAEFELPVQAFKVNVRKLKELGLTESLEVGYRLSPRGRGLLRSDA